MERIQQSLLGKKYAVFLQKKDWIYEI